jgi:predicted nucleic acid-binding protein
MARYSPSLHDANIVAAAGLNGCDMCCSEAMQDGLPIKCPEAVGNVTLPVRGPFNS